MKNDPATPLYTDMATQTNSDYSLEPPKAPELLANDSGYESSNLILSTSSKPPTTHHCYTSEPVQSVLKSKPRPDLTWHTYDIDHRDSLKRM